MTSTLSLEEQALGEWLEGNVPVERLQARYGIQGLGETIQDYFKRFVDAAYEFHTDPDGEMSVRGAANAAGLDLWVFEYFMTKFKVDRTPGNVGLRKVQELKKHPLYGPSQASGF